MRIMGLDYGDKTIGVAVSDGLLLTAQAIEVVRRTDCASIKKSVARLGELIKAYDITTIVLGYPKNMDNSEGFRCANTIAFKERLERNFKRVPVVLWDERLSTVAADRTLGTLGRKERDQVIDKMAAVFILQGYLDRVASREDE